MRKILPIILLSLALSGCAALKNIQTAIQLGTASVSNPVTKDRLNQMEAATTLVFIGLKGWKKSCVDGLIPPVCKDQIASVQVYTRQIPPYLTQLRTFVKTNDQVNATVAWNEVLKIIDTVKSQAATSGIDISTVETGN